MLVKNYGNFDIETKLNVTQIFQERASSIEFNEGFIKTMSDFIDK